ncbi:DUF58 domain-containing protein [Treponema sp.]
MTRHELLKRISTFPLVARELANDLLSGDFRSVFKGQGIEFDEVRRYERGDDVRSIDWNVSARFGAPFVKLYREERELTVFIVLDISASMASGGGPLSRREQATLAAALIALSAERAGERLGAILFDAELGKLFRPRKGRSHAMAIVEAALSVQTKALGSALGRALIGASRLLKRRSLVVVISDFLCSDWEKDFAHLARHHDVAAIRISDPSDYQMPDAGLVLMKDPETGAELQAPTGFASFRGAWAGWHEDRRSSWRTSCQRRGASCLELSTADDPIAALRRFFGSRRQA